MVDIVSTVSPHKDDMKVVDGKKYLQNQKQGEAIRSELKEVSYLFLQA